MCFRHRTRSLLLPFALIQKPAVLKQRTVASSTLPFKRNPFLNLYPVVMKHLIACQCRVSCIFSSLLLCPDPLGHSLLQKASVSSRIATCFFPLSFRMYQRLEQIPFMIVQWYMSQRKMSSSLDLYPHPKQHHQSAASEHGTNKRL